MSERTALAQLREGFDVQLRVIGALIMRELHTRFGRDNIGYLWMFAEPMILASAVAVLHIFGHGQNTVGVDPVPFTLGGYCGFMIFRSIVSRAEAVLHANQPLLYHRTVTIFDMLVARALLEGASTTLAFAILIGGTVALGMGPVPGRPLTLLIALVLMVWFSFALSLLVCAGSHASNLVPRLVHPATYIAMPVTGGFFLLKWIPEPYRTWLSWSPMNLIFELVHMGQFASYDSPYINYPYLIGWCLALTYLGLVAINITRRHIQL
jgi:capsular polysaccharide transport system permease protein